MTLLPVALLLGYVLLAAPQGRTGRAWPPARTAAWAAGTALLAAGVAPSLMKAAHHDVRAHMWQHLLLGMFAPVALVYAKPITLLLRSLPRRRARRVVVLLGSLPFRAALTPVAALGLNVGGLYLLYATPLYRAAFESPALHGLVHLHIFLAGYLFTHVVLGLEPSPLTARFPVRLALLVVAAALHATLSKAMYAYGLPAGTGQAAAEVRQAAQIMYYGGDLAEVLLAVVLFATSRSRWPWPVGGHLPASVRRPLRPTGGR